MALRLLCTKYTTFVAALLFLRREAARWVPQHTSVEVARGIFVRAPSQHDIVTVGTVTCFGSMHACLEIDGATSAAVAAAAAAGIDWR